MNGVLGHFFCTIKAELGRGQPGLMTWSWDETLPQCSIDRSTLHTAAHRTTSELAATPSKKWDLSKCRVCSLLASASSLPTVTCRVKKQFIYTQNDTFMWPLSLVFANELNSLSASHDNWCTGTLFNQDNYSTVGGDGGCRVGEVRAGTTSPMPNHKGFMLQ